MLTRSIPGLTLVAALGAAAHAGPPCPWYEVEQIVPGVNACGGGDQGISPRDLNQSGIAVGDVTCYTSGTVKAWYWNGRDPMVLVPVPPGTVHAEIEAVSADGLAVGTLNVQNNGQPNFAFVTDGVTTTVIETPVPANTIGKGISSNGVVAGRWTPSGSPARGFTWQDGDFTDHGTFGAQHASIEATNSKGDIAGYRYFGVGFQTVPFARHDGNTEVTDIVLPAPFWTAEARFINDDGVVAGRMLTEDLGDKSAFMWNDGSTMTLPPVAGAQKSDVRGMGSGTLIVGFSETAGRQHRATLWRDGVAFDIADLVHFPEHSLNVAEAADADGRLVVRNTDGNTLIILTPVFGDANCDGTIDWQDLLAVLTHWGLCGADCPSDVSYDGNVGIEDLESLFANWGRDFN